MRSRHPGEPTAGQVQGQMLLDPRMAWLVWKPPLLAARTRSAAPMHAGLVIARLRVVSCRPHEAVWEAKTVALVRMPSGAEAAIVSVGPPEGVRCRRH